MPKFESKSVLFGLVAALGIQPNVFGQGPVSVMEPVPANTPAYLLANADQHTNDEQLSSDSSQVDDESIQIRTRHPGGKIKVERWVSEAPNGDYVNNGTWTAHDPKGEIVKSGSYEMGKPTGDWHQLITHADATRLTGAVDRGFKAPFTSRARFVDGQLDGQWTVTDKLGNPLIVWEFSAGQRNGTSTWYTSQGIPSKTISYQNNIPEGPAQLMSANPGAHRSAKSPVKAQAEEVAFQKGRMLRKVTTWYDGRKKERKKTEEQVLIETNLSMESHDWMNSTTTSIPTRSQTQVRHGLATIWHPNGNKSLQGQFDSGVRVGIFTWWYSSKQKQSEGNFVNGKQEGRWVWWHENGMKKVQGEFTDGIKTGIWSQWEESGKLVARTNAEHFQSDSPQNISEPELEAINNANLRELRNIHSR